MSRSRTIIVGILLVIGVLSGLFGNWSQAAAMFALAAVLQTQD